MADGSEPAHRDALTRVRAAMDAARRRARALSLRARLLALTVGLAAIGLTVAGVLTYGALRSFLTDRVDRDLREAQRTLVFAGSDFRTGPGELPRGTAAAFGSAGSYRQLNRAISVPVEVPAGYSNTAIDGREYRLLVADELVGDGRRPSRPLPWTLIVGIPLDDVNDTLDRLVVVEILVGLAVLGAIGGTGFWLIRLGMRPLQDIEATAAGIAGGDLSRRINESDARTEVGRLGRSLNTMLGTIEASFREREESERRLRQFVADASHELQTPLTSVRGYAELFRRGAAERPEDLANAMSRIEAESARMGDLVDDLLLLARLDQGRPLESRSVDLAALAAELVGDARVVDPGRPIELDADEPVCATGDEARLRQVIANLLANARTHTPTGTPIAVRVLREGSEAVVEVADRGPGLSPQDAARVFERFFRADPSRTRASGGSGLGLSIVAAIVAAHGGRVGVESEPGAGARFRVVLPADPSAADGISPPGDVSR